MRDIINKARMRIVASHEVATEILKQLGGMNKLIAMIGAKNFVSDKNSIQFQLARQANKINIIKIQLESDDTYTLKFYKVKGFNTDLIKQIDRIMVDRLKPLIEKETGLRLALAKVKETAGTEESFVNKILKAIKLITHEYKYSNDALVNNKGVYIEVSPDLWGNFLFVEKCGEKIGIKCELKSKFQGVPTHKYPPDIFFPFTSGTFTGKVADALEKAGYKVKLD